MKNEARFTCEEVFADLPLFVGADLFDGDLDAAAVDQLQRHLEACAICSEEYASLKRSRLAFLSLGEGLRAPGLWPDVRAVLAAEGRLGGETRQAPVYRFRAAAAAVLIVGLGLFAWSTRGGVTHQGGGDAGDLVLEDSVGSELNPRASSLRPLTADEFALREGAEIFGLGEGVVAPTHTGGGASAAGLVKIR